MAEAAQQRTFKSRPDLAPILSNHAVWLQDPSHGGQANFTGMDISTADLSGATLDRAVFADADLRQTGLNDASLHNVDLSATRELHARQLRGADLTGSKLPDAISESLQDPPGVDEATRTSRAVFLTMLASCSYCWLTIVSTTDASLLTGTSMQALPILQTPLPLVAFFIAAPALLLIVYLYLHFSLLNLWEALATLPAIFPDGRPLHERALPWIMGPIVRTQFKRLAADCPLPPKIQAWASRILAWWSVPITLAAFWARFIVRQNLPVMIFQAVLVAISVWLATKFWRITRLTLNGSLPNAERRGREHWYDLRPSGHLLAALALAVILAWLGVEMMAGKPMLPPSLTSFNIGSGVLKGNLSVAPPGWDGTDLTLVSGATLSDRPLRGLAGMQVFAVNTDFSSSDLAQAHLAYSDLRGSNFGLAILTGAQFDASDLRGANFTEADLNGATFYLANLQGAQFTGATGLTADQIGAAENRLLARFEADQLLLIKACGSADDCSSLFDRLNRRDFSALNLLLYAPFYQPDFTGADLRNSTLPEKLENATLMRADLRGANFTHTDLTGANLEGADLRGTDLTGAAGLTRLQIESAHIDGQTKLPDYLERQEPFTRRK